MPRGRVLFARLIYGEQAQATTEYVLLLAIVLFMFLLVKKLLQPALQRAADTLPAIIEKRIFNKNSMHRFPVGR